MRHWKVAPASVEVKAKVGVLSLVGPVGPESIVVCGGEASTPPAPNAAMPLGVPTPVGPS